MKAGSESWSPRLVRLYGHGLGHRTPYLVYEYVPGGDLVHWLATRQTKGRGLKPPEVLELIAQVAEALAFAHQRGLVHRDLKPANVLMGDGTIKLADFGIGGLIARQAVQASRIGTMASSRLSPAEQASLFRGAGTPLYMSPEQRRGDKADPRHDLYSLGVVWYQLLVGDVTREMSHGWERELEAEFATPRQHINLIASCVGRIQDRPKDADELVLLLRLAPTPGGKPATKESAEPPPLPPDPTPTHESERFRQGRLLARVKQLLEFHKVVWQCQHRSAVMPAASIFKGLGVVFLYGGFVGYFLANVLGDIAWLILGGFSGILTGA